MRGFIIVLNVFVFVICALRRAVSLQIKHFSHRIKLVQPGHTHAQEAEADEDDSSVDSATRRRNTYNVALTVDDEAMGTNACIFSTSYNKVVKAIASRRVGVAEEHFLDLTFDVDSESFRSSPAHSPLPGSSTAGGSFYFDPGTSGADPLGASTAATLSQAYATDNRLQHRLEARHEHIAVKQEHLRKALRDTLERHPVGEQADSMLVVIASNPHVSIICDKAASFRAGDELVTVAVGGNAEKHMDAAPASAAATTTGAGGAAGGADTGTGAGADAAASGGAGGCPIFVQTAPGIKMLTRVAQADVLVNLPGLLRFTLAHFNDIPLLKEYIETCTCSF